MKATIYFDKKNKGRKYIVEFPAPTELTRENMAFAISEAMIKADKRKVSRQNMGRYYNLLMKVLPNVNIFLPGGLTIDTKESAFRQAVLLNKKETDGHVNRVGITQAHHLVIDIDSHDVDNCKKILTFYEELFGYPFRAILTGHGFWLIGTHRYDNLRNWLYDNCRLLCPGLKRHEYESYRYELMNMDTKNSMATEELLRKSRLFSGVGIFDLLFVFINIKREHCTLRISKKSDKDKIVLVR